MGVCLRFHMISLPDLSVLDLAISKAGSNDVAHLVTQEVCKGSLWPVLGNASAGIKGDTRFLRQQGEKVLSPLNAMTTLSMSGCKMPFGAITLETNCRNSPQSAGGP